MKCHLNAALALLFTLLTYAEVARSEIMFEIPKSEKEGNDLLDRLKTNTLPQVQLIERCIRETNGIVSSYSEIKHLYMGRGSSDKLLAIHVEKGGSDGTLDLNIHRNFEGFGESNTEFFKYLNEFIEAEINLPLSTDLAASNAEISAYTRRIESLKTRLQPLVRQESYLLSLLDRSKNSLLSLVQSNSSSIDWLLGESCKNASVDWKLAYIKADSDEVLASVTDMRNFVLALRTRRANILKSLEIAGSQRLENHWRKVFVEKGTQTLDEIKATLDGIKLGAEIRENWIQANLRGLGDNLHLKYLQFRTPLRLLITQLGRLSRYESKVNSAENLPIEMKNEYLALLKTYRVTLNRNIDDLMKKGWKGQLDRQVLLNSKRLETASGECASSIQRHLEMSKSINSEESFAKLEKAYLEAVNVCSGK